MLALTARLRTFLAARGSVIEQLPDTHPDKIAWRSAHTLQELADLNALWLAEASEGPRYHPALMGADGPDHEDPTLAGILVRLNRAGLLTHCSQPGDRARGWEQRAAVTGFVADAALRSRLMSVAREAGLIVHSSSDDGVVVTHCDGHPHTWFGRTWHTGDLEWAWSGYGLLNGQALAAIRAASPLTLAAPQYGPSSSLWDVLDQSL